MSLIAREGIPIPTPRPESLERALPPPQIQIPRQVQQQDAWCYAACASMVIIQRHPAPTAPVRQCKIAKFIKHAECCHSGAPQQCTNSGCRKDQIASIFTNFVVASQQNNFAVLLDTVAQEIAGNRLIEVVIDWTTTPGQSSSHAVLLAGVNGDMIFVVDPLPGQPYGEWHAYASVLNGFQQGRWSMTWIGLT